MFAVMFPSILVRLADTNDAEAIAAVSRKTFYDTFAAHNTPEDMEQFLLTEFTTERLMAEVGAEGNYFLVAFMENELVGYARLREAVNPPELGNVPAIEIARIYALEKTIGRGVGKVLMQRCIGLAREKGRQLLWLGVWEHNQRAIDFYIKWGFEKFSSHAFVLGRDVQTDWLMKLTIDS
ncbi:MAG TPA: GNAT family N-acetyltransferase [Chitinophagaceae bacterium]